MRRAKEVRRGEAEKANFSAEMTRLGRRLRILFGQIAQPSESQFLNCKVWLVDHIYPGKFSLLFSLISQAFIGAYSVPVV